MSRIVALVACILCLAIGTHAGAAEDKDDWIRGKLFTPEVILRHQSKLKLTEQQRAAIGAELKRVQGQAAESDWLIMSEGLELQELVAKHPVDVAQARSRAARVLEAENRKKLLYLEMLANLKNLLNAEQVKILQAEAD